MSAQAENPLNMCEEKIFELYMYRSSPESCWIEKVKGGGQELWASNQNVTKIRNIFLEMKLRGLIHVSMSDLSIPTIGPPISQLVPVPTFMYLRAIYIFPRSVRLLCSSKIGGPIVGIYKSLTYTWMWKLGTRQRSFISGNTSIGSFCNAPSES
jgi:hypothetical protein